MSGQLEGRREDRESQDISGINSFSILLPTESEFVLQRLIPLEFRIRSHTFVIGTGCFFRLNFCLFGQFCFILGQTSLKIYIMQNIHADLSNLFLDFLAATS